MNMREDPTENNIALKYKTELEKLKLEVEKEKVKKLDPEHLTAQLAIKWTAVCLCTAVCLAATCNMYSTTTKASVDHKKAILHEENIIEKTEAQRKLLEQEEKNAKIYDIRDEKVKEIIYTTVTEILKQRQATEN